LDWSSRLGSGIAALVLFADCSGIVRKVLILPKKDPRLAADDGDLPPAVSTILHAPDLPQLLSAAIALHYAGDTRVPQLGWLTILSNVFPRPTNLSVIAASSSGKSFAMDVAVMHVPEECVFTVTASSPRAFIYTDADFSHRTIFISEADSLPEDGPAASAMRSIAEEARTTYMVTEANPTTGRFGTRTIEKVGPTGLITTSTKPLTPQLATRMLVADIDDSPAQTRAILRQAALRANGLPEPSVDQSWIDALRWLREHGERRVAIPFASALAELIPAAEVRVRRDFPKLLTLIMTSAFLQQRRRECNADGFIVASVEDYLWVRELLVDSFTATVATGVTDGIRAVVAALQEVQEALKVGTVTQAQVARAMKVGKTTALHRVRRAIEAGYVVDLASIKYGQSQLAPGEPLPDVEPALPTVERLQAEVKRLGAEG
jgi:hypothetical protein